MKSIVFYYSRTGKTAVAAKTLADRMSSELVEIKDLKNRMGILGWLRAGRDASRGKDTQIDPSTVDTSDYDTICFGSPVWGGKPTPAINTIIKNCEVVGKDVILFVTLGGSSSHGALNLMRMAVEAKGGNVIKTIAIENSGKKSDEDIIKEINEIQI